MLASDRVEHRANTAIATARSSVQNAGHIVFFVSRNCFMNEGNNYFSWLLFSPTVYTWTPKFLMEQLVDDFFVPDKVNSQIGVLDLINDAFATTKKGLPGLIVTDAIHNAWKRMRIPEERVFSLRGNVDSVDWKPRESNLQYLQGKVNKNTLKSAANALSHIPRDALLVVMGTPTGELLNLIPNHHNLVTLGFKSLHEKHVESAHVNMHPNDAAAAVLKKN